MVINTNVAALTSAGNLNKSTNLLNQSLARLSSGSKLVSPADNPAGMAESTALNAQIGETNASNSNVSNAIAFSQTQDGYLQQVGSALDEMSSLAVSAQDETKTDTERADYQKEFSTLLTYVSETTSKSFNGVSLFSSSAMAVPISSGESFSMTGVAGNYINAPVTTTTTTTQGYSANTKLGQISSAFNDPAGDEMLEDTLTTGNESPIGANSSINDLVNLFNQDNQGSTATYDANTGQLAITVAAGSFINDVNYGGNAPLLDDLGFSGIQTFGIGDSFDGASSEVDNYNGTSPITITATLAHTITTTTTTTPTGTPDVSTAADAKNALATVTAAISQLASDRATVGANLERLNYTSQSLGTLQTNLSAANSQISDVDVAEESTNYAREQILVQSGTSMLAQANSAAQSVLKLLS